MSIKVSPVIKEVKVRYTVNKESTEIVFRIPSKYPLQPSTQYQQSYHSEYYMASLTLSCTTISCQSLGQAKKSFSKPRAAY
ncbi:hypothetical protein MJO28_004040 [Puccinia striiformis f. sp. tritici]|uniref:Uncharacterized protein n=1 Tax=Puccinia striiformis f. sp. tritici TaxID=168172 RepID=A0ACC0EP06_9BASI|nr:hypothetical protein MJO28_004040 [Puccinia striiformis f. sp. tritici]